MRDGACHHQGLFSPWLISPPLTCLVNLALYTTSQDVQARKRGQYESLDVIHLDFVSSMIERRHYVHVVTFSIDGVTFFSNRYFTYPWQCWIICINYEGSLKLDENLARNTIFFIIRY
jgi:hypothetical protein